ncbi:hypothetical protein SSP24_41700 [Streptomyces spinoverrucosus]|uniref:Uncharacterized protein n=1 Tax=Streptomyces spinoverrucosus TaxID=284043 RepID=A0A4Y3VK58_9ACTN|nr:hypothetical protein SSP24_41700 [Streptomyces spinoverrucosus]GHB54627.1 hypothetical protein GCM10010397_26150 [Streptomyces spinoverrucosus]
MIIQSCTPFIWPLLVRLLHRIGPGPMLVTGFLAMAAGQLWLRALPIHETALLPMLGPLILNGVGFGLVAAAITAAAVNVVPQNLTGMAAATTGQRANGGRRGVILHDPSPPSLSCCPIRFPAEALPWRPKRASASTQATAHHQRTGHPEFTCRSEARRAERGHVSSAAMAVDSMIGQITPGSPRPAAWSAT